MANRVSRFIAVLIVALALAGCGMGTRYAQNYATYTATMDTCTANPTTITVPGPDNQSTTIEQPNPACANIQAPEHELRYVGPMISDGVTTGINAGLTIYQTERTTRSAERRSRYQQETLQKAFEAAGPRITGSGNAITQGGGTSTSMPPMEESSEEEMPDELVEDL
jgi:hypothetical protein